VFEIPERGRYSLWICACVNLQLLEEQLVTCFMMITSANVWAVLAGMVSAILLNMDADRSAFSQKMDEVQHYMVKCRSAVETGSRLVAVCYRTTESLNPCCKFVSGNIFD
jgi:hypothetical protein